MFEIVATKGLYVEPVSEVRGQEFEMILPANSQFRVVGVKELAYGISGEVRKTYQMEQL